MYLIFTALHVNYTRDAFQVTLVLQKIAIQTSPKPVAVAKEHFLNNGVVQMVTGEKAPPSLDDVVHGVMFLDPKVGFMIHFIYYDKSDFSTRRVS